MAGSATLRRKVLQQLERFPNRPRRTCELVPVGYCYDDTLKAVKALEADQLIKRSGSWWRLA